MLAELSTTKTKRTTPLIAYTCDYKFYVLVDNHQTVSPVPENNCHKYRPQETQTYR